MNKALSLFENPRFNFLADNFIGFDDMFRDMDNILSSTSKMETFPPYDIRLAFFIPLPVMWK